ncbi:MAG: sigma-54-dependent Fis family transcriptional regulator, partial [Bacteroidetes bacterium]|nr:sigma-54-dependent Fis family transcriptional regulator [Bacteroidota bacterium]
QSTDVRVVAATNKNLLKDIQKGKFREDLYYRLSTVQIETPSLRDRGDDVQLLFRKFSSDFAERNRMEGIRLLPDAMDLIQRYNWPGNVRQLKNVAEQCTLLSNSKEIDAKEISRFIPDAIQSALPKLVDAPGSADSSFSEREILYKIMFDLKADMNDLKKFVLQMAKSSNFSTESLHDFGENTNQDISDFMQHGKLNLEKAVKNVDTVLIQNTDKFNESEEIEETHSLADMEKMMIVRSLEKYKGKRKDAADELGISERTLYRKIKEYKINL